MIWLTFLFFLLVVFVGNTYGIFVNNVDEEDETE